MEGLRYPGVGNRRVTGFIGRKRTLGRAVEQLYRAFASNLCAKPDSEKKWHENAMKFSVGWVKVPKSVHLYNENTRGEVFGSGRDPDMKMETGLRREYCRDE